jgi:hypothetical protein
MTAAVVLFARNVLPGVQAVLNQGATTPLDFTLHDGAHSYRVAERMVDIVNPETTSGLAPAELGLLLLAAYLHDIGMTPPRVLLTAHAEYLRSPSASALTEVQAHSFQSWLDQHLESLTAASTDKDEASIAEYVLSYYCRDKHVEWTTDWIQSNLSGREQPYSGFLDDLLILCASHHQGLETLLSDVYNPRLAGSPAHIVHLRFLAVMLRVADVLEFDPGRTPDVIYHHRNVRETSGPYWWKDHDISIDLDGNTLVLSARPSNAVVYRAVEVTADDVERELRLARRLDDETHFDRAAGLRRHLPHSWHLSPYIHRDISPRNESFEYIDGSFRPNTRKLLSILSGTNLYGSALVAVRELVQNAFDAVREEIARRRLAMRNPNDENLIASLSRLYFVDVSLIESDGRVVLRCSDNGVGMTKEILTGRFLVSGAERDASLVALRRRCRDAGFDLHRTGRFGIGALSYFMLGRRAVIRTRRSESAGDSEATGWRFESSGTASFGELRRDPGISAGTVVDLELRQDVLRTPAEAAQVLRQYLRELVITAPCVLSFSAEAYGVDRADMGPGWTEPVEAAADRLWNAGDWQPPRYLWIDDDSRPGKRRRTRTPRPYITPPASVRFYMGEGSLPEGLGRYRFVLPYYVWSGGVCLFPVDVGNLGVDRRFMFLLDDEDAVDMQSEPGTECGSTCRTISLYLRRRV